MNDERFKQMLLKEIEHNFGNVTSLVRKISIRILKVRNNRQRKDSCLFVGFLALQTSREKFFFLSRSCPEA